VCVIHEHPEDLCSGCQSFAATSFATLGNMIKVLHTA